MDFGDYIAYVDESGDHSLASIDPDYPIFVLTFCVFRKSAYVEDVCPAVQRFKFKYFGHDAVVLHEHEIRKQVAPFAFLRSKDKREAFMRDLGDVVEATPMTIISAVIDKQKLAKKYAHPANPYSIALLFCMERFYAFLRDRAAITGTMHIVVECRGKKEDAALELEFRRIKDGNNHWGRMDFLELVFADKKVNLSGLQLADLTARPIGLKVLRPGQPNRAYETIEPKIRTNPRNGRREGYGFKVFP